MSEAHLQAELYTFACKVHTLRRAVEATIWSREKFQLPPWSGAIGRESPLKVRMEGWRHRML